MENKGAGLQKERCTNPPLLTSRMLTAASEGPYLWKPTLDCLSGTGTCGPDSPLCRNSLCKNTMNQTVPFLPRRQQQFSGTLQLQQPDSSYLSCSQTTLISSCCASHCDAVCFPFQSVNKTHFPLLSIYYYFFFYQHLTSTAPWASLSSTNPTIDFY